MHNFDEVIFGSLDIAQTKAYEHRNPYLEPVHLLYGMIVNPNSKSSKALKKHKKDCENLIKKCPVIGKDTYKVENVKPSSNFSSWVTQASSRAIQAGRKEVGEADLLSLLGQVLPEIAIDFDSTQGQSGEDELEMPAFLTDLNEMAAEGKLDPVIGRSKEIRAVMEILGRRRKNNPVLVGDAGVGKTAVVEGLAELIHLDKVPDTLRDKVILSLDLGALMAGTKYRGEFEERLQTLVKYMQQQAGQAILFIDELHQLVGAGKTDGAMDAANLLKPALARGELHCIGATTHEEFRKYILSDSALERRFRSVPIAEPSVEDAIEIMMGLKDKFEIHHGVEISDDAIFSSVFLSSQYIPNKNLPDKAIDLVDEASAALKLSAEAMPANLVELEAEIRSKMVYSKSEKADKKIMTQIEELQTKFDTEKAEWDKEVLQIKRLSELKNNLDRLKFDLEKAQSAGNFEEASRIKYSKIPEVEKELSESKVSWTLSKKDVAQVIARQTGIPVEKILKSKQENILGLEAYLNSRVFGQKEALHEISETLVAAHAGLTDPNKPLGSFLLLGPTGVGKTETAKALSQFLFEKEDEIVRIDMSEYSEKHSCAKLIGAPAGYVGYEDGGILTEAIRRKPYAVVLFDEIEKAHPDFSDILLQVMDDGRLTDNKGQTISFKNTVIILTSNSKNVTGDFKPEVLGRLDAMMTYKSLDQSIMSRLVTKQVQDLNDRLRSKNLVIELGDDAAAEIAKRGYDDVFGARPLKTVFSKMVTRPLSHQVLAGVLPSGVIRAKLNDEKSVIFDTVST